MARPVVPLLLSLFASFGCGEPATSTADAAVRPGLDTGPPVSTSELFVGGIYWPEVWATGDGLLFATSLVPEGRRLVALSLDDAALSEITSGDNVGGTMHVSDEALYWIWKGTDNDFTDGALLSVDRRSGSVTPLLEGLKLPVSLAAVDDSFVIAEYDADRLIKVSATGEVEEVIATGGIPAAVADASRIAWTEYPTEASAPATLNVRTESSGEVRSYPLPFLASPIAILANEVFLASYRARIAILDLDSGEVAEVAPGWSSGEGGRFFATADDTHLYWLDSVASVIYRMELAGRAVETFVEIDGTPLRLVVGDTYVYWALQSAGEIRRALKQP